MRTAEWGVPFVSFAAFVVSAGFGGHLAWIRRGHRHHEAHEGREGAVPLLLSVERPLTPTLSPSDGARVTEGRMTKPLTPTLSPSDGARVAEGQARAIL